MVSAALLAWVIFEEELTWQVIVGGALIILSGLAVVLFEPEDRSDHAAVMLGGSYGGIPEGLARRLAENGVTAFALGYFGAPGVGRAATGRQALRLRGRLIAAEIVAALQAARR